MRNWIKKIAICCQLCCASFKCDTQKPHRRGLKFLGFPCLRFQKRDDFCHNACPYLLTGGHCFQLSNMTGLSAYQGLSKILFQRHLVELSLTPELKINLIYNFSTFLSGVYLLGILGPAVIIIFKSRSLVQVSYRSNPSTCPQA